MTGNCVNYPMLRFAGFVFGIPILLLGFYLLTRVFEAQTWPWTTGVVSRSGVGTQRLFLEVPYRVGSAEYVCRKFTMDKRPAGATAIVTTAGPTPGSITTQKT